MSRKMDVLEVDDIYFIICVVCITLMAIIASVQCMNVYVADDGY